MLSRNADEIRRRAGRAIQITQVADKAVQHARKIVGRKAKVTADAFEVISWVLFLVAGFTGLSRMEWTPEVYRLYGIQDEKEEAKRALQKAKLEGLKQVFVAPLNKSVPVDQYIAEASQSVATVKGIVEPLVKRSAKKYRVMKYGFVAGLLALMLARAWVPIGGIVHAWWTH